MGKLKAIKIGRNWVTTKIWLIDYLQRNSDNSLQKTDIAYVKKTSLSIFSLPAKKNYFIATLVICGAVFALSCLALIAGNNATNLMANINNALPRVSDTTSRIFNATAANTKVAVDVVAGAVAGVGKNISSNIGKAIGYSPGGAAASAASLSIGESVNSVLGQAANWVGRGFAWGWQQFSGLTGKDHNGQLARTDVAENGILAREVDRLEEDISGYTAARFDLFRQEVNAAGGAAADANTMGLVLLPSNPENQAKLKNIEMSFSDDVTVHPIDETSGLIIPQFKEKENNEYLYLMVPVIDK